MPTRSRQTSSRSPASHVERRRDSSRNGIDVTVDIGLSLAVAARWTQVQRRSVSRIACRSGGTGMGQAYRGAERFLKPGEKFTAAIDGIGSITMNVVAEPAPPPGTGSRLPAVSSYRKQ